MSDLDDPSLDAVERRLVARAGLALPAGHRDQVLAAVRDTLAENRGPVERASSGLDAGSRAALVAIALSAAVVRRLGCSRSRPGGRPPTATASRRWQTSSASTDSGCTLPANRSSSAGLSGRRSTRSRSGRSRTCCRGSKKVISRRSTRTRYVTSWRRRSGTSEPSSARRPLDWPRSAICRTPRGALRRWNCCGRCPTPMPFDGPLALLYRCFLLPSDIAGTMLLPKPQPYQVVVKATAEVEDTLTSRRAGASRGRARRGQRRRRPAAGFLIHGRLEAHMVTSQFSVLNPATRPNSLVLSVTSTASTDRAWAAIMRS